MLFRGVAIFVLFLTTTICGMEVLGCISAMQHSDGSVPSITFFTPVVIALIVGVALATLLEGMQRLIQLSDHPAVENTSSSSATIRLLNAIAELQTTISAMNSQPQEIAARQSIESPPPPTLHAPSLEVHLERMVKLLEEMKEVSMLDETQRQSRRKQTSARRKSARLEEAARHINKQNWEEADALLHLLESLHPGDEDVLAIRNQLDDSRIASQADEWDHLRQHVETLLSLSNYEDALDAAGKFLDRFPTHPDCKRLAVQIRHELSAHTESQSNRLYDEIKTAVEARQWRTALDGIDRFLEQFPDHARAAKIKNQVRVIQKNAEIEERRTLEDNIRDLIAAKQYGDAADLSQRLLARFPDSPQAAYLTELLPKLRERSGDVQSVGAESI